MIEFYQTKGKPMQKQIANPKALNIPLKDTPILCEFIKRLFKFDGSIELRFDICSELKIISVCRCGDSDCATVMLKRDKDWKDEIKDSHFINTTKGMVIVHFLDNGFFELEALMYDNYPYKQELERVFNGDFSSPNKLELDALDEYFADLITKEIHTIIIDD